MMWMPPVDAQADTGPNPLPLSAVAVSGCRAPDPCLFDAGHAPKNRTVVPCVSDGHECETREASRIVSQRSPVSVPVERTQVPQSTIPERSAQPVVESQPAVSGNRALGQEMAAARGWIGEQWRCLDALWTRESGWSETADNPRSSAYGIPQSLPGSKMASHGADWRTNPRVQVSWGLAYIEGRYGDPCAAKGHSDRVGWY